MCDPPVYVWALTIAGVIAIPAAACVVPLLFTLHITSMATLARAPRPARSATGPLLANATPLSAVAPRPASRAR